MADISNYSPLSGNIIGADNRAHNIVALLRGKTPVNDQIYDITKYPPIGGIVIGNDGRAYDLTELIRQMVITAYQIAVSHGYTGTEAEWLASLKGEPGKDGATAYEQAVAAGFIGTKSEWLASLKGEPGKDGATAYEQAVAAGFTGTKSEWLASLKGEPGNNGATAYELAVAGGYTGTQAQWLEYLRQGPEGASAYELAVAGGYTGTQAEWLASLKGASGQGVPTGGTVGMALIKSGLSDFVTEWAAVGRTNPNLLINGDFAINQTGIVSGETYHATQRFIDGWLIGYSGASDNVVWTQGAVTLNNGSILWQYLEMLYSDLFGKTFTVTFKKSDNTYHSATLAFPSSVNGSTVSNSASIDGAGTVQLSFEYRSGGAVINGQTVNYVPMVYFTSNANQTLKRAKLEVGNASTLFMDAPVNYGVEKAKCQRYYRVFDEVAFIVATTSYCVLNLEFDMRIGPTVTVQQFLSGDHTPNAATCATVAANATNLTVILVQNTTVDVRYAQYLKLDARL